MNIKCTKLTYAPDVPRNERYPFSEYEYVQSQIDLAPYLTSVSSLKYQSIFQSEIKTASIQYETSNVTIELSPDAFLREMFFPEVFSYDLDRFIFIFELFTHSGQKIFTGFANYQNISRDFTLDSKGKITVEILGMEKAFKDYFSVRPLPHPQKLFDLNYNHNAQITYWYNSPLNYEDKFNATCIKDFTFWDLLFAPNIHTTTPPTNFPGFENMYRYVNCVPQLYSDTNQRYIPQHTWWLKSGYNRFYAQNYNCYELLEKACIAHGWKWYIETLSTTQYNLCIRDMSYDSGIYHNVDSNKMIDIHESFWQYNFLYDYILIPCGWSSLIAANHSGSHFKLITNKFDLNNESNFFRDAYNYNFGKQHGYAFDTWYETGKYYTLLNKLENSEIFSYYQFKYNSDNFKDRSSLVDRWHSKFLLNLDAGSHDNIFTRCNQLTRENYSHESFTPGQYDLLFTGNVGDCFFQWNPSRPSGAAEHHCDYNDYSQLDIFYKNYKTLLYSSAKHTYDLSLNYLIASGPNTNINYEGQQFSILSLELDCFKNSSKLQIIQL